MLTNLPENIRSFIVENKPGQVCFTFENGYGASVIRTDYSYGGSNGFYELAVLDKDNKLCYNTPVTNDVLGWLDEGEVEENLLAIQAL